MRSRLAVACASLLLGAGLAALPASADVTLKNEEMIAVRQALMRVNSSYEGLLEQQAKGTLTIPASQMRQIGEAVGRMGKLMPGLFQKGSEAVGNSRAKPEVWSDATGYKQQMEAYVAATAKLQQVSTGGDVKAINEATASFAKSCEDCHKPYRAPAQR